MKVGFVCNREVVFVDVNAPVREAVELMRAHHVGDVVVITDEEVGRVPVGILTDRDVALAIASTGLNIACLSTADLLARKALVTANVDDEIVDALARMRAHSVRRLPVVSAAGALEGILALDDIIELVASILGDVSALVERQPRREAARRWDARLTGDRTAARQL